MKKSIGFKDYSNSLPAENIETIQTTEIQNNSKYEILERVWIKFLENYHKDNCILVLIDDLEAIKRLNDVL